MKEEPESQGETAAVTKGDRSEGQVPVCMHSFQLCPTLFDPMDCSLHDSSVHGRFPRQEHLSGLPCPPLGDLSHPVIEPAFPAAPALKVRILHR